MARIKAIKAAASALRDEHAQSVRDREAEQHKRTLSSRATRVPRNNSHSDAFNQTAERANRKGEVWWTESVRPGNCFSQLCVGRPNTKSQRAWADSSRANCRERAAMKDAEG